MSKKEKKYQITSQILIVADGWVIAKNIKEAKEKWEEFCIRKTVGLSYGGIEINEVITPRSKHYDKDNIPDDSDFNDGDCITHNYIN